MAGVIRVTPSSGNVFADLGLNEPEERLAKAELAVRIWDVEITVRKPSRRRAKGRLTVRAA